MNQSCCTLTVHQGVVEQGSDKGGQVRHSHIMIQYSTSPTFGFLRLLPHELRVLPLRLLLLLFGAMPRLLQPWSVIGLEQKHGMNQSCCTLTVHQGVVGEGSDKEGQVRHSHIMIRYSTSPTLIPYSTSHIIIPYSTSPTFCFLRSIPHELHVLPLRLLLLLLLCGAILSLPLLLPLSVSVRLHLVPHARHLIVLPLLLLLLLCGAILSLPLLLPLSVSVRLH